MNISTQMLLNILKRNCLKLTTNKVYDFGKVIRIHELFICKFYSCLLCVFFYIIFFVHIIYIHFIIF